MEATSPLLQTLLELRSRKLAEDSLYEFVKQGWKIIEGKTPFVGGFHLEAICAHLEAIYMGDIRKLIINIPPRMSKTSIVAIFFPAWVWIHRPECKFLCSSYAYNLAEDASQLCRNLIKSDWYKDRWFDKCHILPGQDTATKFFNNGGGHRQAVGIHGTITGKGGNILICFPAEITIETDKGKLCIGDIVENNIDCKVLSYNHALDIIEYKEIEEYEKNPGKELIEIDLGDRILECTEDHPIFVEGKGYIMAKEIQPGDEVLILT